MKARARETFRRRRRTSRRRRSTVACDSSAARGVLGPPRPASNATAASEGPDEDRRSSPDGLAMLAFSRSGWVLRVPGSARRGGRRRNCPGSPASRSRRALRRPGGRRASGKVRSPFATSGVVNVSTGPPAAATRFKPDVNSGAKTIVSSSIQTPPRGVARRRRAGRDASAGRDLFSLRPRRTRPIGRPGRRRD
jgi:hypothetical protein